MHPLDGIGVPFQKHLNLFLGLGTEYNKSSFVQKDGKKENMPLGYFMSYENFIRLSRKAYVGASEKSWKRKNIKENPFSIIPYNIPHLWLCRMKGFSGALPALILPPSPQQHIGRIRLLHFVEIKFRNFLFKYETYFITLAI